MLHTLLCLSALACSTTPNAPQGGGADGVRTPSEHLGRSLGADFTLADWGEVSSYFWHLDGASERARTEVVGKSTEGRDFLLTTISDPENLARLEELKHYAEVLADPRGRTPEELAEAVERGKVFLFISCAMHATECAGNQFGMAFAHELATSEEEPWKSARREMVINVIPSQNPDGTDHVTNWYRETVGTPYEATGLLKLYQYYAGHDNNRDWFMLTQNETRITTELLYKVWRPQVYWDVHQQGSTRERFFVPPFRDPLNPNLEPMIISGIDALGSRVLLDMTREGFTGVSTGVSYDMWWNGGNRNVPVRHNIIGLLTEAASADLATPIFLPVDELSAPRGLGGYAPSNRFPKPWPGGWWRIRDIIDYELAFGRSLLASLSRERAFWLQNASDAAVRAIAENGKTAPLAWILPSDNRDPSAVRRLCDVLLRTGVELHVSEGELRADGRSWPAGSVVILRDQPYGIHVKDLLEVQRYPEGDSPYDVSGWTLPFLLGVERVETMAMPEGELRPVETVDAATAAFGGDPRVAEAGALLSTHDSSSWTHVYAGLEAGQDYHLVGSGDNEGLLFQLEGRTVLDGDAKLRELPRIGLYTPWSGVKNEGWMRYVLDSQGVPYVRVRNEMLRAGRLDAFLDVLILPSLSSRQLDQGRAPGTVQPEYARGIEAEGAVALEEFVRGGGTLITMESSGAYAIELFGLPLVDVTRGEEGAGFSCPGSVLRTIPEESSYTAGLPASVAAMFSRSRAWRTMTEKEREEAGLDEVGLEVPLRYAPTRLLMSGWIQGPEVIEGEAAWVVARHGEGLVHLFGFRPQYRGWSTGTFGLVHRAALLNGGE